MKGIAKSEKLSSFLASVLMFLGELARGDGSEFRDYFRILPKQSPLSLINWTQEELSLLKGKSHQ